MSKRDDIPDRLIYTCNCGWVDKGHANGKSTRPNVGAESLWKQVSGALGPPSRKPGAKGYRVTYTQDMGARLPVVGVVRRGVTKRYFVQKGLSEEQRRAVALAIFMEVSVGFEIMQGQFPYNLTTDSSFSVEDLVSNLIGFYQVVFPKVDYMSLCRPVSAEASRAVWDSGGAVGATKQYLFQPHYFPCAECTGKPQFPKELGVISPAEKGLYHRDWDLEDMTGKTADALREEAYEAIRKERDKHPSWRGRMRGLP